MSKKNKTAPFVEPEFNVLLRAEKITSEGYKTELSMSDEQRKAVAKRLEIVSVDDFKAQVKAVRLADGCTLCIEGSLKAHVTQECVVTLDPVPSVIEESFLSYYLDEGNVASFASARRSKREDSDDNAMSRERPIPEEGEELEALTDGAVNIGELCVEAMVLGLDPYPHSDAAKERDRDESVYEDPKHSPFEVLKDLKIVKGEE
jgi:uncharacterized metal-binding protein YceD (DUF177 family)